MKKTIVLVVLSAVSLVAQVPTISNITVNAVSHSSVNIQFRTPGGSAWVQLKYGLSSGNYIYTSASYQSSAIIYDANNVDASLSLGGLAPGTTYYVLPTARPDMDDDANICATAACGAVEQVFTTLPLPAAHPAPPAAPAAWIPSEPDTSSYTVIPMQVSNSNGECVAAASVSRQAGWSGAVSTGDNITTILGKIFYGTVIEFPQGISCKVFQDLNNNGGAFHTGYTLPSLALDPNAGGNIDSPAHRWIVFRTQQVAATDFPPFGVRTGPQWASKLARFVAQTPANPTVAGGTPPPGVQNLNGQIFDCFQSQCHHFWFENLEFTHLMDTTVYPAGIIDPPAFGNYIRLTPEIPWNGLQDNQCPDYNVIDRVYAHGNPSCQPSATTPCPREMGLFAPGGNHWAIINSYAQANMWTQGVVPSLNPTLTGAVFTIPKATYQWNALDNTPIGMTGPATATFLVPAGYTGSFWVWLDSNGLTIDYQAGTEVSATCSGCTLISEANPSRASMPPTSMFFFAGLFDGNGKANLGISVPWSPNMVSVLAAWRPLGLYPFAGNYGYADNNFIEAIGQTIYNDSDGNHNDQTFTHNHFYFPRSKMKNSGQWDGLGYSFRNVFESKQGLRWRIEGNILDGSAAYQNPGNAMYVAGSYTGPFSNGTQDFLIRNNIFRHLSSGLQCAGGGAAQPPDSPTAERIEIANNLWIDLNRDLYNNGGGGFFSGPFASYPGCTDLNIHNNTVDLTKGPWPALFLMGGAGNGVSIMAEGLNISDNEMHMSLNNTNVPYVFDSIDCNQIVPSHPASPASPCFGGSFATTFSQAFSSSFIHAGSTITPSWSMTHNVVIGALTGNGGNWTDIDGLTMRNIADNFPPGNIFPTGATMAARREAVKWDPVTFRITPSSWNSGDIGADVDAINSAAGIVRHVNVSPSAGSVQFSYVAPDTRSCYVDVSPDGVAWSRTVDNGGANKRLLTVVGLAPGVSYQYRLMCYFDQQAEYEFLPDEITTGSFSTVIASIRQVQIAFHMPAGAAQAVVTLNPLTGSPLSQTCNTSPCALSVTAGSYTKSITYQTSAGIAIGPPDVESLTVN